MMHVSPIAKEVAYYERSRADLVSSSNGKFVLIKNESVEGTFDRFLDAMDEGYRRFGSGPFLVRKISQHDEVINVTSLLLSP